MEMNLSKLQEIVKDREAWQAAVHEVERVWTQLSDNKIFTHSTLSSNNKDRNPQGWSRKEI